MDYSYDGDVCQRVPPLAVEVGGDVCAHQESHAPPARDDSWQLDEESLGGSSLLATAWADTQIRRIKPNALAKEGPE